MTKFNTLANISRSIPSVRAVAIVAVTLLALGLTKPASACPKIGGLIDYNCDQKITMGFFGDSITYGVGDKRYSATVGGYPQRLKRKFPTAEMVKLAKPGTTAQGLFRLLHKRTSRDILDSGIDYGFVLVGVNDYWDDTPIEQVVNTIERIASVLKSYGMNVSIGTPTPTKRGYQREFIEELQNRIATRFPTHLHFDTVDLPGIGWDGLHPSAAGYKEMGLIAQRFIRGPLQTILESIRRDRDDDGVYDNFESNRFLTSPDVSDTDTDGLLDGDEIFTYLTDPLVSDTDGDTVSDGTEIANGTNPLDSSN